jgi:ribosomal-protein-serine acetyltransferase
MDAGPIELLGKGLTLRNPVEADAPLVAEAVRRSLPELAPWMPWAVSDYDSEMAEKWIRGEFGDLYRFLMVDDDGGVAGTCGLNRIDELNRSANLGYWVHSGRTGRGHATEATRLLARFGLDQVAGPAYRRLEVAMSTKNHASRRVAEKAGATFEGTLRQALLLRDEYHDAHIWSFVLGDV